MYKDIVQLKIFTINEILDNTPNYKGTKLFVYLHKLRLMIVTKKLEITERKLKFELNTVIEMLDNIIREYSKNPKLVLYEYLNNLKESLNNKEMEGKNHNNKLFQDDNKLFEDDSEYETSDSESEYQPNNKRKRITTNKTNKKTKNNDYEEDYGDDGSDDEDDISEIDWDGDDEDDWNDGEDDDDTELDVLPKKNKDDKAFLDELLKNSHSDSNTFLYNYYLKLNGKKKQTTLEKLKEINNYQTSDEPLLFKLIELNIPIEQKNNVIKKYLSMVSSQSVSSKLKNWIDSLSTIPFGKYLGTDLKKIKNNQVKKFLDNLNSLMDKAVWGHEDAKRHIVQIMAQQIRNPDSKGNIIGLYGPPGTGKTSIIKDGIAKAMDKPFVFISLGGASDASFLEGHSYTYEGSIYGRIVNGIIASKCMNPIIYFDELDKISKTPKGDEITNILIHLTDPNQNSHFRDKYFHGIDIDLSKVTFIFSYNDPSLIDRVLADRITQIETKYLLVDQKIHIAQNYLLPEIKKDIGFTEKSVGISDDNIKYLIEKYTHEGGVRRLKSVLYMVMREINIANMLKKKINNKNVIFPYNITIDDLKEILKNKREILYDKIHSENKCGIINGMYAQSDGSSGGILPIQALWMPAKSPLEIKATGSLQQVITESISVASTLAFNQLNKELQDKYIEEWKEKPRGLHIHMPDGSVQKDGPSAGTAITVALYSILTGKKIRNDIAITGEITFEGKVTAIGGLDNKLEGAKKAGIKLALYPSENQMDLDKIKEIQNYLMILSR